MQCRDPAPRSIQHPAMVPSCWIMNGKSSSFHGSALLFPTLLFKTLFLCQEATRLCTHLNQQLNNDNPLNGIQTCTPLPLAAFSADCLGGAPRASSNTCAPHPGELIQPARKRKTSPVPCSPGLLEEHRTLHFICLNEHWDSALLTLWIQGFGMAAVLGSCLQARAQCPCPSGDESSCACLRSKEMGLQIWGYEIKKESVAA